MDGWNTGFLLGWPTFRGYVSFGSVPAGKLRLEPQVLEVW